MPGSVTGHPVPFLEIILVLTVLESLAWESSGMVLAPLLQRPPPSLGLSFLSYKTIDLGYLPPRVISAFSDNLSWSLK